MIIVAVTDANIFIDLMAMKLLKPFLSLDITIWTSEEVLMELYPEDMEHLISIGTVRIDKYDKNKRPTLKGISRRFSSADKSLLELVSKLEGAKLLSGENRMRSWGKKQGIEVHGIIWVLDFMIEHGRITSIQAAAHLSTLLTLNNWLPQKICLDKIDKWRVK